MASKKREIYARAAVQLRTHDRAVRAESVCPGAMGLYFWMLLQARGEETRGDVLEASALASWGAPTAHRRRQLEALIAVGLVERIADGRVSVVRYLDHNDGPEEINANREASRSRVAAHRKGGHVTRYTSVTNTSCNADVPSSCSSSLSGSGSADHRSEDPTSTPRATPENDQTQTPASSSSSTVVRPFAEVPDPSGPTPPWWSDVLRTVAETPGGATLPNGMAWIRYAGHRAGKRLPATREDALYWLGTVMVPEAHETRRRETHQRERDAKYDAARDRAKGGPAPPLTVDPKQAQRDAEAFAKRIAERKAREGKGAA